MTPLQQAYDFETPVEMALALALGASNIAVYTPSNEGFVTPEWQAANAALVDYIGSSLEFRKKRPRVELFARAGNAEGRNYADSNFQPIGGYSHELGRVLSVGLKVITDANILKHRVYLAEIRGQMATMLRRINGDDLDSPQAAIAGGQLAQFRIPELAEAGSSYVYSPETGVYQTDLTYNGHLTTQEDTLTNL